MDLTWKNISLKAFGYCCRAFQILSAKKINEQREPAAYMMAVVIIFKMAGVDEFDVTHG